MRLRAQEAAYILLDAWRVYQGVRSGRGFWQQEARAASCVGRVQRPGRNILQEGWNGVCEEEACGDQAV